MSGAAQAPRRVVVAVRHPGLRVRPAAVAAAIGALDAAAASFRGGCPPGELSVAFLTDRALARLHGDFLADPAITDVITFPGDPSHGVAGEICISVDAAVRQAGKRPPGAELLLYLVHGWLHLAGYDDLVPAKKRVMRAAERRATRLLEAAGAAPGFRLRATAPKALARGGPGR